MGRALIVGLCAGLALTTASLEAATPGEIQVTVDWGRIHVVGHEADTLAVAGHSVPDPRGGPRAVAVPLPVRRESDEDVLRVTPRARRDGHYEPIDLSLAVPAGVKLVLRMRKGGEIEVRSVVGDIQVRNDNGSVVVERHTGTAMVDALNGSVDVSFLNVPEPAAMSFTSHNGDVTVELPPGLRMDVQLRPARGDVDLRVTLESSDMRPNTHDAIDGRLNGGGPLLFLATRNGRISLWERSPDR